MKVRAYAKVNLALDVVRRREDGFHDLEMIMAPIFLHDLILVDPIYNNPRIEIEANSRIIPLDDRNIVYKVAKLLMDRFEIPHGVRIKIYKHIPMQAGLAGGSADGAAVLRAMNELFNLKLSLDELAKLGDEVGSDIPFCIYQQFAFVQGKGENLEFFKTDIDYKLLLVKPRRGVSTKQSFTTLNLETCAHPDCRKMMQALIEKDDESFLACLGNSLEEPSFKLVPEIQKVKEELVQLGFDGVIMSGSGSCVFGLTKDEKLLEKAHEILKNKYPFVLRTRFKSENEK